MHPELVLVVHCQLEATLERELAHLRAGRACPGCVVHPPSLRERAVRFGRRFAAPGGGAVAAACCPA